MSTITSFIKSTLTLGKGEQSFIDAKWIIWLLKVSPPSKKRFIALWILSLSPHYFFRDNENRYQPLGQFLNAENKRNMRSREKIRKFILSPYLRKNMKVLDYGCGPGWLPKAVSRYVRDVYAVDISLGALNCGKIINPAPNIHYIYLEKNNLDDIPDGDLDLIYSFAVVQHISDSVFKKMLSDCAKKLKANGTLLLHVQLELGNWKSEAQWKKNKSLAGRLKYSYGLHCFSRKEKFFRKILPRFGFKVIKLKPIASICRKQFDDICKQHLIVAKKSSE